MDKQIKVLLCGDVEGNFDALFKRVENINSKSGPFELLLCVGNFFGKDNKEIIPYKTGLKTVPVLTYILGANNEHSLKFYPDNDEEICPNVYHLGKRGLYTSTGGLKIAYISGMACKTNTKSDWNFVLDDLKSLRDVCLKSNSSFRGVDVLLSSPWPAKVTTNHDQGSKKLDERFVSDGISWLSTQLKPRYHVSALQGIFYERPPFRFSGSAELEIATRFIGLAKVGNPKKEKWLHALCLTPVDKMSVSQLIQKTTDETLSPYDVGELEARIFGTKNKRAPAPSEQYFYDMTSPQEQTKSRHVKRQKIEFDQSKCWFCLASPTVEKHLIISVGDFMYLTLAKGGIVDEHFLICPIEHCQCSLALSPEMSGELQKFKKAVRKFYKRKGEVPVFFERNYKTSHMQIQCVPVPKSAESRLLRGFKDQADVQGLVLEHEGTPERGCLYFSAELPTGESIYIKIDASRGFPMNFGRQVLGSNSILKRPDRVEWKDCLSKKEDEEGLVKRIRADYKSYDFTE